MREVFHCSTGKSEAHQQPIFARNGELIDICIGEPLKVNTGKNENSH